MNLTEQASLSPSVSYRTIPLTKGQVAIVDAADYDWLMQWKWHAGWNPHTNSYYAKRSERVAGEDGASRIITYRMHRELLGLKRGDPHGDHVRPADTLDNRRSNLRLASCSQNKANSRKHSNNTSGFKGVSWHKDVKKYSVNLMVNRKSMFLGYVDKPEDGHAIYCEAATRLQGEFARFK